MSEQALIQVNGLSRHYGPLCAVDSLTFETARGEIVGLLGPNGAGKSTTMAMLCGVLAPSAGRIRIGGEDLQRVPRRAKRLLGYLPEQAPVYPELTTDEYLAFCARLHGLRGGALRSARARVKQRCGLDEVGARLIGNLSRGYRQRIGLAQALLHEPRVVVLDEPTAGLDPLQLREVRALIGELRRDCSILLSTHILPEVAAVCDRVLILSQGRIVHQGPVAELAPATASLHLRCARDPERQALAAVPGVRAVRALADGGLRLEVDPENNPAPALARLVVERGWGLLELAPGRNPLEQLFVELTCGEQATVADGL